MLLSVSLALLAPAAALDDTCATPTPISGEGTWSYDTTGASTSGFTGAGDPCDVPVGAVALEDDVFFVWSPHRKGTYAFNATSADLLDQIALYRGGDCAADCLVTEFQPGPGTASGASLFVASIDFGQSYLLQLGAWGPGETAAGSLQIQRLDVEPNVVCNDAFHTFGELDLAWDNSNVWTPFPIDPDHPEPGCPPEFADLFYVWTAMCDGTYRFHTENTSPARDTLLAVLAGSDCTGACIGWSDDVDATSELSSVLVNGVQSGDQFLIQVGTPAFTGDQGTGTLSVERIEGPCPGIVASSVCDPAAPHVDGRSARLEAAWIAGAAGTGLHLEVRDGPAGRTALMLMSVASGPAIPLNQGTLCLQSPFARYHPQAAANLGLPTLNSVGIFDEGGQHTYLPLFASGATSAGFDVPFETPAFPGIPMILVGDTWAFQLWFRDETPSGAPSSNLSNAIEVQFV